MQKEEAIKRINKIGFAGWVIALIAKILLFVAVGAAVVGLILVLTLLPKGFLTMRGGGAGAITMDLSVIGQTLTDEDRAKFEAQTGDIASYSSRMVDGSVFAINSPKIDGNVITFDWSFAGTDEELMIDVHNLWIPLFSTILVLAMALVSVFFISALCKAFRYCASPFDSLVITKMRNLAFSLIPWTVMSNIAENVWEKFASGSAILRYNISVNFGMILVVLIVFVLVYIFKYGAVLQRESDETL